MTKAEEMIGGCTREHWRSSLKYWADQVRVANGPDSRTTAELLSCYAVNESRRIARLIGEPEPFPDLPTCPRPDAEAKAKGKARKPKPSDMPVYDLWWAVHRGGPAVYFVRANSIGEAEDFVATLHPKGHHMRVSGINFFPPIGAYTLEVPR